MQSIVKMACLLVCLCAAASGSYAQQAPSKIGHINIPQLLASLESWKSAQSQIETHKKMLEDKIGAQQKALEAEYIAFEQKAQRGEATQKEITEKQNYFVAKDNELKQSAQKAQQELEEKTITLTSPIQEKLKAALKTVAAQGNFNYILDSSMGDLLFLDPALDVMAAVKASM